MKALSKTLTSGNFDEVFIEVPHEEKLGLVNSEQLRLFHLNVVDKAFSLKELQSFLRKNIGQYVFSRMKIEEYELSGDAYSVGLDAIELMRRNGKADEKGTGNELGEILLYAFLEEKLNAPKIMSKVELQTDAKQSNSKCDSIHLLSLGNDETPYYHMIFGTSSIDGDVKDAIDMAFRAVTEIRDSKDKERTLAENTVFSRNLNENTVNRIRDILIPDPKKPANVDTAFGLFLGYSIGLNPANYSSIDYRRAVNKKMELDIKNHTRYIAQKIVDLNLEQYSFYLYVLPLDNATEDKKTVMDRIINGGQ